MKTRNITLDYIKAFAIILVVLGHSIQYGSGDYVSKHMFDNGLFMFIYSFHMPIFMLVSGYLFYNSVNRYSTKQLLINKAKSLLIPIAFWTIFTTLFDCLLYDRERLLNPFRFGVAWVNQFIGQFWFLWAVFICSAVVILIHRFLKDNILAYIAVLIITLFTPDVLLFSLIKFMYPFFVIGYMVNKYNLTARINKTIQTICFALSSAAFIVMLIFCKSKYFIYNSGYTLLGRDNMLEMLYIDAYRFFIGLFGSFVFVFLISKLSKLIARCGALSKALSCLGKNTMGIYILSFFFAVYALPPLTSSLAGVNYFIAVLETIAILGLSLLIIFLIKKNKWTNRIMLGNWK